MSNDECQKKPEIQIRVWSFVIRHASFGFCSEPGFHPERVCQPRLDTNEHKWRRRFSTLTTSSVEPLDSCSLVFIRGLERKHRAQRRSQIHTIIASQPERGAASPGQ